jgi:hypothetical protein
MLLFFLTGFWCKSLQLVEGIEKPHMDQYREITNDWNYEASCMLMALLVWDLGNSKCLVFVAESIQCTA